MPSFLHAGTLDPQIRSQRWATFVLIAIAVMLAITVLLALLPTEPAASRADRCRLVDDTVVSTTGHVRILRQPLSPRDHFTRRYALFSCWRPSGRRTRIALVEEAPEDVIVNTRVEIVDGRYVGAVLHTYAGPGEYLHAAVFDARRGRRLHSTSGCHEPAARHHGPFEVVFLPHGGLAYSCDGLVAFIRATSMKGRELEPPGTPVSQLAVALHPAFDERSRLYWTTGVVTEPQAVKSLELPY